MGATKVLKKSNKVVSREIEGEVILMPLYSSADDLSYIYTLNETAAATWDLIDGKRTLGDIKNKLLDKYNVSEDKLAGQLNELAKDLKSIKAIK